jgi:hypothetical protein
VDEYRRQAVRGFGAGLKLALPLLGLVGAAWLVLAGIAWFHPITDPIAASTFLFGPLVGLIGYLWFGIARVRDGLGWSPLRFFTISRNPLEASEHIWRKPRRFGRPMWLGLWGMFLFFETFGMYLLKEQF